MKYKYSPNTVLHISSKTTLHSDIVNTNIETSIGEFSLLQPKAMDVRP